MINLSSFIRTHAKRDADALAYTYAEKRVTYGDFFHRIERLGGWLKLQGIKPGDVVAVFMKNSSAFLEATFAISHIGAVLLPINYRLSAEEVEFIVLHSGAVMMFADDELMPRAGDACRVVAVDAVAQSDLLAVTGECAPAPMEPRHTSDLLRLMYTSGTTDRPKGVMHSYENFYWKSAAHAIELWLSRSTRLLTVQPLYHVGAFDLPGLAVLWCGGAIILHRDFDADAALSAIARERVTGTTLVPVLTGTLLAHPDRHRHDVSSLRWVVGGGEKTPESRIRAFSEYFVNARYIDAYGLTESCSGDTFMAAGRELEKIGSAGRATLHVDISIRDAEGRALPAGVDGEICLRGPKVTRGYWKDSEKTAASFHGEWFRTGDVGHLDEENFLFLTDRLKDMIKSGGENIASSEVERVLYELPQIREAAVIGVPDAHWGERPVAIVALTPGSGLDYETLARHCRSKLAGFKVPKELRVVDALPRNATGKILKRDLRRLLGS